MAEKEAIRKRGEAAWLLWKKGWMLGCCEKKGVGLDAVEKRGSAALYALAGEGRTNGIFKFSYVINASSILIEYVSKCLARHHISVKFVKSVREKKHSAVMSTQIAQITQIFMLLAAAAWGVCIAVRGVLRGIKKKQSRRVVALLERGLLYMKKRVTCKECLLCAAGGVRLRTLCRRTRQGTGGTPLL